MEAILYVRFSTLEQRTGASVDRQMERCTELCGSQGWPIAKVLIDEGKSAFAGKHREAGAAFGDFEAEALQGIHAGKVLVVERLSRLSRLDYNETYDLMRALTKRGVTVATWDGGKVYRAGESIDFVSVIELLVKAKTANEESQTKRDFGRDKWARRRAAMREGKIVTKTCPPWLCLSDDRSDWIEIEDRCEIVRQMFRLSDQGASILGIMTKLNSDGIKPWPRYQNREPKIWDRGTVNRILRNPAVIGDLVMFRETDEGNRLPVDEPVRGYYPRIIEPDVFERVQRLATARKQVSGGRSSTIANLVSGYAYCSECGGGMEYVRGRRAGTVIVRDGVEQAPLKQETATLYCRTANRKGACTNRAGIAYIGFERALLDSCLHLAMDDRAFGDNAELGRLTILLADRRRDLDAATGRAKALWEGYAASQSVMAMQMAQDAERAATSIKGELDELDRLRLKAAGELDAAEQLSRLNEVRSSLYDNDLDVRRVNRLKVATALRATIERITCHPSKLVEVSLRGSTHYVRIMPGAGRRPATYSVLNMVHPTRDYSDLDRGVREVIHRDREHRALK